MARPSKLWAYGTLLTIALWAGGAHADEAGDQARARYERALSLYEEGVYDAALVELRRAYEIRPAYKLLYNIGQVRLAMKDYAGALETFQQYLREGGGKVPNERRVAVEKDIANLEQRVARLTIAVDLDGTELFVDDAPIGESPLKAPVIVNSGQRRVTARHPERPAQTVRVSIAGGERQEVTLRVGDPAPSARTAVTTPPPESTPEPLPAPRLDAPLAAREQAPAPVPPKHTRGYAPWIAWGSTGALALSAVGIGVMAKLKEADLKDARGEIAPMAMQDQKRRQLDDMSKQAKTLGITTDVLIGATALAAGASLWLTLRPRDDGERVHAALRITPTSLHLRTEF